MAKRNTNPQNDIRQGRTYRISGGYPGQGLRAKVVARDNGPRGFGAGYCKVRFGRNRCTTWLPETALLG